jgi:hypothetical protein
LSPYPGRSSGCRDRRRNVERGPPVWGEAGVGIETRPRYVTRTGDRRRRRACSWRQFRLPASGVSYRRPAAGSWRRIRFPHSSLQHGWPRSLPAQSGKGRLPMGSQHPSMRRFSAQPSDLIASDTLATIRGAQTIGQTIRWRRSRSAEIQKTKLLDECSYSTPLAQLVQLPELASPML